MYAKNWQLSSVKEDRKKLESAPELLALAREWFDKAVAWTDKHQPDDPELKRFRAEAEEVLGLGSSRDSEDEGQ